MYVTGPAERTAGRGPVLRRAEHRVFPGSSALARDPALRPYLVDLAGRAALAVREDVFTAGAGHSYTEMALPLVESVTSPGEPVDLLVLAYGVHDVQPGRNTALYLASRCPGDPLAFAVTDHGTAAAFAALRVIGAHFAAGGCARAVLVVAEQAALHYPPAAPAPLPDRHAAAVLLFEVAAGATPPRVRQRAGVPAEAVGTALAAEVAEVAETADDPAAVTLVVGPGVELEAGTLAGVREVRRAPAGLPHTGLWSRLCEPAGGGLLVLVDHDPFLGHLNVAALQPAVSPTRPSSPRLGDLPDQPAVREQEEV